MKRILATILILALILPGCSVKEKANFYYCRKEYQFNAQDSVIVSEKRDISGHTNNLEFLLSLYMMGPLDADYSLPFPDNVALKGIFFSNDYLTIELTHADILSDSEFSLACACIALTCFELTEVKTVSIISGSRILNLDASMLTLYDSGIPVESTDGGEI